MCNIVISVLYVYNIYIKLRGYRAYEIAEEKTIVETADRFVYDYGVYGRNPVFRHAVSVCR